MYLLTHMGKLYFYGQLTWMINSWYDLIITKKFGCCVLGDLIWVWQNLAINAVMSWISTRTHLVWPGPWSTELLLLKSLAKRDIKISEYKHAAISHACNEIFLTLKLSYNHFLSFNCSTTVSNNSSQILPFPYTSRC